MKYKTKINQKIIIIMVMIVPQSKINKTMDKKYRQNYLQIKTKNNNLNKIKLLSLKNQKIKMKKKISTTLKKVNPT